MKKLCAVFLVILAAAGCAIQGPPLTPINYSSAFNKAQAERLLRPGKNTIIAHDYYTESSGRGRHREKETITCAGRNTMTLMPATARATEFVQLVFHSREWVKTSEASSMLERLENAEDPDFWQLVKQAPCEGDGLAIFSNVADGEFYVLSWLSSFYSVKKVSVKGGQTVRVTMSYNP